MTEWHLGHSMCARTNIGDSVHPQYLQRGASTFLGGGFVVGMVSMLCEGLTQTAGGLGWSFQNLEVFGGNIYKIRIISHLVEQIRFKIALHGFAVFRKNKPRR